MLWTAVSQSVRLAGWQARFLNAPFKYISCEFNAVITDEYVTITTLLRSESNIYWKSIFDKQFHVAKECEWDVHTVRERERNFEDAIMKTVPNHIAIRVCISEYTLADELFMKCAAYAWQACNVNQFINNESCSLNLMNSISKFLEMTIFNATVCCSTVHIISKTWQWIQ